MSISNGERVAEGIAYIGVDDHDIDLFEGQYAVPNGMAYNSYAVFGDEIAVMDSVDERFADEWISNIESALGGASPDYIVVQHMEPDHSGSLARFAQRFPQARIVSSKTAFRMMGQFFGTGFEDRRIEVVEGDVLDLGRGHALTFVAAPMVHWPEVMMTYDPAAKALFSADAFGKFGALDADEEWDCEARRYYFGIVGKYGPQVRSVLSKASGLDIETICPLHGPMLTESAQRCMALYAKWAAYEPEDEGVAIAYTSVYGHTRRAVELIASKLEEAGCPKVAVFDLARDDMAEALEDAFRYSKLVLATTTYNNGIFPPMRTFIGTLVEHAFQNRTVALVENGTWAPAAAKVMRGMLEECKDLRFADTVVSIKSALSPESEAQIDELVRFLVG